MKLKQFSKIKWVFQLKNAAFTLAEVLIVLGVIGIVAEMTIPTLMNDVSNAQYKSGIKKAASVFGQAYLYAQNDNAGNAASQCAVNDSTCFAGLLTPYLRVMSTYSGTPNSGALASCWANPTTDISDAGEPQVCVILNDGMAVSIDMEYQDCQNDMSRRCAMLYVDVNGIKSPNKWGKDRYVLDVLQKGVVPQSSGYGCNNGEGAWTSNIDCAYAYMYQQ